MRLINVVGLLVGVYLLVQSYRLVRRREEDTLSFLTWTGVGLALVGVSLFPNAADYVMRALGMEMRAYTIFTLGILIAYVLLFRLFRAVIRLDQAISTLNEEISLLKAQRERDRGASRPTGAGAGDEP